MIRSSAKHSIIIDPIQSEIRITNRIVPDRPRRSPWDGTNPNALRFVSATIKNNTIITEFSVADIFYLNIFTRVGFCKYKLFSIHPPLPISFYYNNNNNNNNINNVVCNWVKKHVHHPVISFSKLRLETPEPGS